jgi:UDP-GlcNAc:undecaprenyl-phosphate GlcNAc-1-phosphate transferase
MITSFLNIIFLIKFYLISLVIVFFFLSFFWKNIFEFLNFQKYNSIQRIHAGEIPRLGGFFIYFFWWILVLGDLFQNTLLFNILLSSIPFFIVALKEDLYHNTSPAIRLSSMILSCVIFFIINPINFPIINIYFIGELLQIKTFSIIFFIFCTIVLMNGMNLIDGMNGLFAFTALFQLLSLFCLSIFFNDYEFSTLIIIFFTPLIIFLLFNYPFGMIFAGDSGAYLYGFINAIAYIYFFGRYPELLSWLAVLFLFYPCFELLFSYSRKILDNKSPLSADNKHLHTLLNKKLLSKIGNNKFVNAGSTLVLFLFWLLPFIFGVYFSYNIFMIVGFLLFLSVTYCIFYITLK